MTIPTDSPLIRLLERERKAVVTEEMEREAEGLRDSDPKKKLLADSISQLKDLNAAISFPLISGEKLVGVFNLGEKISGDIYTDEDINLISSICHQMAIAIENQRLQEESLVAQQQVLRADKLVTAGTLAASYAHDIRNPLAAVKGVVQSLALTDTPDPETIEMIKKMVPEQIDRVEKMISNILGFVRAKKKIPGVTDISSIIKEVVELMEVHARKAQVKIVFSPPPVPISFHCDSDGLLQAFTNVALNGIQAMTSGGTLAISLAQTDGKISVAIRDTGAGISPENLTRIYAPFFTTKETGVGLGLSIVQRIVSEHRGEIKIESEVGKGTAFTISLPVA